MMRSMRKEKVTFISEAGSGRHPLEPSWDIILCFFCHPTGRAFFNICHHSRWLILRIVYVHPEKVGRGSSWKEKTQYMNFCSDRSFVL